MKFQIPFSKIFGRFLAGHRASRLLPFAVGGVVATLLAAALLAMNGGTISAEEFRTVQPIQNFSEGEARQRADWFYYQRAYPAKTIPADAGFRMRDLFERKRRRLGTRDRRLREAERKAGKDDGRGLCACRP